MEYTRRSIEIIKPLDHITNYLSNKSKFPSLSTVIPAYEACMDGIAKVASHIPSLLMAQKAIHSKLNIYYMAALEKMFILLQRYLIHDLNMIIFKKEEKLPQ